MSLRLENLRYLRFLLLEKILLGSEGGDDFLEAWIAAQRIPHRAQAQVAISVGARSFGEGFKLPKRQFSLACPGTDHRKVNLCAWLSGFVFDARRQFHRAPAIAQCLFFSSQACIDQPQIGKQACIIRVTGDLFLLLCACSHKSSVCRSFVSFQTSDYTHPKVAPKLKAPPERILLGKHRRSAVGGVPVAIVQSKSVALPRHNWIFL